MAKRKRKTIFEGIRKETAPPTQYFKNKKKSVKADVVGRKEKYKNVND